MSEIEERMADFYAEREKARAKRRARPKKPSLVGGYFRDFYAAFKAKVAGAASVVKGIRSRDHRKKLRDARATKAEATTTPKRKVFGNVVGRENIKRRRARMKRHWRVT